MDGGWGPDPNEWIGSDDPLFLAGVSPAHMVAGYRAGLFPMDEEGGTDPVGWYLTDPRAVITPSTARVPRTAARMLRRRGYDVRVDTAFAQVVQACSGDRTGVWLTPRLVRAYEALHQAGIAHSIEAWDGPDLVGGLFGVTMGGLVSAESMFHRAPDGGNAVLAGLVRMATGCGYVLIDVQMASDHVMRFGAEEVDVDTYRDMLARALATPARPIQGPRDLS